MGKSDLKRRMFLLFFNLFCPSRAPNPATNGSRHPFEDGRGRYGLSLWFTLIVRQARIIMCKHGRRQTRREEASFNKNL
jgi:hypothetical protein